MKNTVVFFLFFAVLSGCTQTTPPAIENGVGGADGSDAIETGHGDAVDIEIFADGFRPANITIEAGTTVTFHNHDSALHWPASNPHPVHTDLAGFDARRGLAEDEEWSFTFAQPGAWDYHDHLRPSMGGTVTVQ